MAKMVYYDTTLLVDGWNLSGDLNRVEVDYKAEIKDATGFGTSQFREKVAGLKTLALNFEGFLNVGDGHTDPLLFDSIGASSASVLSMFPVTPVSGGLGYICQGFQSAYNFGGQVGDVAKVNFSSEGTGNLVRGTCMGAKAYTETENGTAYQLGAVTADQRIYLAAHVTAASGTSPTIDIKLQSDDNEDFTSAIDRITLSQATAAGDHEWSSLAGAITDEWWRIVATVGGTDPSLTAYVVAGIL